MDGWMSMEYWWNESDRREIKYWEKSLFRCHFIDQNPTCIVLELNQGFRIDRPATSLLVSGTVLKGC